ncbi:MAG: hypothetical protein ACJAS1_002609 [Oleiphilaceae bacterium]
MLPPITHRPVPPMTMTAERFIDCAWLLDFKIISAESSLLDGNFITQVSSIAKSKGIDVQYLDFSCYKNPTKALTSPENESFLKAIEDGSQPRLLLFNNCDSLSPLSCSLTYSLRSVLTTRMSNNVQSVFVARQTSLDLMFTDSRAAFYHSNHTITERLKYL